MARLAALPPAIAAAAICALDIIERGESPLEALHDNIRTMQYGLLERGFRVLGGDHPLMAIDVVDYAALQQMVNHLYDLGIYVHGLCYPVVPEGEARIRMMVSALHSEEHLNKTLEAFVSAREAAEFSSEARLVLSGD